MKKERNAEGRKIMWNLLVMRSFARAAAADDRPVLISVVCILGFMSGFTSLLAPLLLVNPVAWLTAYMLVSGIFSLACMIALWRMRLWAVPAFILLFIINQIVWLSAGIWSGRDIPFSLMVIAVGIYYFRELE
ncbi:MAG: hypothetical protein HZB44_05285 [Actinobacteria bacterium]|nr:hypothetical protein [Actinomycetota bacterium]